MNAQNWNFPAHLLPAEPTSLDLTAQLQIAVISSFVDRREALFRFYHPSVCRVDRAKAEVKAFNGHVLCAGCVVMERGENFLITVK